MNVNLIISVNWNIFSLSRNLVSLSQQIFKCSNSTKETQEKDAIYVQGWQ